MHDLLDRRAAAAYLGIPTRLLVNQCRLGTGPTYLRPSPHALLFREADLDAWRATWKTVLSPMQYIRRFYFIYHGLDIATLPAEYQRYRLLPPDEAGADLWGECDWDAARQRRHQFGVIDSLHDYSLDDHPANQAIDAALNALLTASAMAVSHE